MDYMECFHAHFRTNYGAAIHHDELYLVGGQTEGGKFTATVDILNLQTMKCSGPPLPYVLMGHRVVDLRNGIKKCT